MDEEGFFYFVRVVRDDIFGNGAFIETAGGGVETGETPEEAIHRELKEELGASVEVLCKVGTVNDYYNQIHRHNVNHYFSLPRDEFRENRNDAKRTRGV